MKRKLALWAACMLAMLALFACALAESLPEAAEAAVLEAEWVEAPVEEVEYTLGIPEEASEPEAFPEAGEFAISAPEEAGEAPAESPSGDAPAAEQASEEASAEPEQSGDAGSSYFGEPLSASVIKLKKNVTKTVYLGVPYSISVSGGIASVKSSATRVATAGTDGAIRLKKTGTAKLTVKTGNKKTYKLTLKVADAPAPQSPKLSAKSGAFTLKWAAAKYATAYLVQYSPDGNSWQDFAAVGGDKTSAKVTGAVSGTTWFRVVAILGDSFGGASDAVAALGPVTGVKVVCEEAKNTGPTDRINVTWSASAGATAMRSIGRRCPRRTLSWSPPPRTPCTPTPGLRPSCTPTGLSPSGETWICP